MDNIKDTLKSTKTNNNDNKKNSNFDYYIPRIKLIIFIMLVIVIFISLILLGIHLLHKNNEIITDVNKEIVQKNYIDNTKDLSTWLFDKDSKNYTLIIGDITSNKLVNFSEYIKSDEHIQGISDNSFYKVHYENTVNSNYRNIVSIVCDDCRMLDVIKIDCSTVKFDNTENYGYNTGTFTCSNEEYKYSVYSKIPKHYALIKKDDKCNIEVLILSDNELNIQDDIEGLNGYGTSGLAIILITIAIYGLIIGEYLLYWMDMDWMGMEC